MTSPEDFCDVDWQQRRNPSEDLESGFPSTHFYHPMQAILSPAATVAEPPGATNASATEAPWSGLEKAVFRFAFLYFGLQVVPLD